MSFEETLAQVVRAELQGALSKLEFQSAPEPGPLLLTFDEAAALNRAVTAEQLRAQVKAGKLAVVKIGTAKYIPRAFLELFARGERVELPGEIYKLEEILGELEAESGRKALTDIRKSRM